MAKNIFKVSIVVPVFRVEEYLDECIRSLTGQTYKFIEIILVDDGSDDNCPQKCDAWAMKDTRIRSLHKRNGGLSNARNYGARYASGDYIIFVDSDDILDRDAIKRCIETVTSVGSGTTVIFTYWKINENGTRRMLDSEAETFPKEGVYTNFAALKFLLEDRYENFVWRIFFPRSIWFNNMIQFPEGKLFEDILTTYRIVDQSKEVFFLRERLYLYRSRKSSIMSTPSYRQLSGMSEAYSMRTADLSAKHPELEPLAHSVLYKLQYRIATFEDYRASEDKNIRLAVAQAEDYLVSNAPDQNVKIMLSLYQQFTLFLIRKKLFRIIEPFFYRIRKTIRIIRFHS
jgi:glycosyltransferase involved in cell wall biosynthesis